MSTNMKLDIRGTQSLTMTPQLQQAIKMLQYSSQELNQFLQLQLTENPLLTVEETYGKNTVESPVSLEADSWASLSQPEYDNLFHDQGEPGRSPHSEWMESSLIYETRGQWDGDDDPYSNIASPDSFRDNFISQINIQFRDPKDCQIAKVLFECLDETGYLSDSYIQVAPQFDVSQDHVERIIKKLQKFEPSGLFCRSLQEFLEFQLASKGKLNLKMKNFINHLHFLENHDFDSLTKESGLTLDDCRDALQEIRQLNPKPIENSIEIGQAKELIPDVIMYKQDDGLWDVMLNPQAMPKILVNSQYSDLILRSISSTQEREFLMQRLQAANWLIKALHQRSSTILKVSREIVKKQQKFFMEGAEYLKPMSLKDIASVLSIHESTVSRVTHNKFIATPRGIFELKYFFCASLNSNYTTESFAAKAVQKKIYDIIAKESPESPLSDEQIVQILNDDGIQVARRTVAKYREGMQIPSSTHRKRQKKFSGVY